MLNEQGVSTIDILTATLVVCGLVIGGATVLKPEDRSSRAIAADKLEQVFQEGNLSDPNDALLEIQEEKESNLSTVTNSGTKKYDSPDEQAKWELRSTTVAIESLAAGSMGGTLTQIPTAEQIYEKQDDTYAQSQFSSDATADPVDNISTTVVFTGNGYVITTVSSDGEKTAIVNSPEITAENKNDGNDTFVPVDEDASSFKRVGSYAGPEGMVVLGF